jgi:hypothetical protein
MRLSNWRKGNIESNLEWRHRDLSVRCEFAGRSLPPRPSSSSSMSPVDYSSAMLSSNRLRFTDRSNRGSTPIRASRENAFCRCSTWLPGARLTRRNWLRFYAPPDTSMRLLSMRTGSLSRNWMVSGRSLILRAALADWYRATGMRSRRSHRWPKLLARSLRPIPPFWMARLCGLGGTDGPCFTS